MLILTNIFILAIAASSACLGTAALVQKRTIRRRQADALNSNAAS